MWWQTHWDWSSVVCACGVCVFSLYTAVRVFDELMMWSDEV